MKVKHILLKSSDFPDVLRHIPTPPKELFVLGGDVKELLERPCVAVVGSRKVSPYGRTVTTQLVTDLVHAGVIIISGLAFGVDSIAHKSALDANGTTVAVLPSSLDSIYPAAHQQLAKQIVEQGGALVTEYEAGAEVRKHQFIARNRLISGLADAVLITEAAEKSGSLHTADFALEQGKDVLAVPGNITSPTSAGTNNLIKSGATPVTSVQDIFHVLGIEQVTAKATPTSGDPDEQRLLNLLGEGRSDGAELLSLSRLEVGRFNQVLTMLEIRGLIRPLGNNNWGIQ